MFKVKFCVFRVIGGDKDVFIYEKFFEVGRRDVRVFFVLY